MSHLSFLPHFPIPTHPLLLFGVLLLAGLVGGEVVQRVLRLPRIIGYVLMGMLLGPGGVHVLNEKLIAEAWIFVDIALGLVLFEVGRRLHLSWLVKERQLLAAGLLESALSFALVFGALIYFGVAPLYAAVAGAIGVSTSPAVVMLVSKELRAEGQVTERALHLVAINTVIAFTLTTMLLAWIHSEYRAGLLTVVLHPLYMLVGSLVLSYLASALALLLARWLGKNAERQVVMLLGVVVMTVGAAHMLLLSVPLALLVLGLLVRNLDVEHHLMAVELGRIGQLFFVVLFVVTGTRLVLPDLAVGSLLGIAFVVARFVGKSLGVLILTPFSGVRRGTSPLLCLALTPMSGVALAMMQGAARGYPAFGAELASILMPAILVLELAGPIAVQFALKRSGEIGQEDS